MNTVVPPEPMSARVDISTVIDTSGAAVYDSRFLGAARVLMALTMIGLGVLGFIYGDVAMVWQQIPVAKLAGQPVIAYGFAAIELATGVGLLVRRTVPLAAGVLFGFLLLWAILLKLPSVIAVPGMEATWLGFAEIAVIWAGVWALLAVSRSPGNGRFSKFLLGLNGVRAARLLFAIVLPMIGLSHFFYSAQTVPLIPSWLPFRLGWAYFTGAGSIATCLAILFTIVPRLAATLEAVMLSIITVLVWGLGIVGAPHDRLQWTAFVISWAIAAGAWLIAASYRGVPWLARGRAASAPRLS